MLSAKCTVFLYLVIPEFACFYKRCADRTESAVGVCSQTAEFRTGRIARQRDMNTPSRSLLRGFFRTFLLLCPVPFFAAWLFSPFLASEPRFAPSQRGFFRHLPLLGPAAWKVQAIYVPICQIQKKEIIKFVYFSNK